MKIILLRKEEKTALEIDIIAMLKSTIESKAVLLNSEGWQTQHIAQALWGTDNGIFSDLYTHNLLISI